MSSIVMKQFGTGTERIADMGTRGGRQYLSALESER
jgi:hypothetical protein